jgi:acyl-CoA thioesterase
MGQLDLDTALKRTGDQTFETNLSRDWMFAAPSGGYLSSLALRAVSEHAQVRYPISISVIYVGVATLASPLTLTVTKLKAGKRSEAFRVAATQDGSRSVYEAHIWTCSPTEDPAQAGLTHDLVPMPKAAAPEDLLPGEELPPEDRPPPFPFWTNIDARRDHYTLTAKRPPRLGGWFKYRPVAVFDDPFTDSARPLILLDALVFGAHLGPHPHQFAPATSLDVVAHYHRRDWPLSAWLYVDVEAEIAVEGRIHGRGRVWDESGRLVASGVSQMLSIGAAGSLR